MLYLRMPTCERSRWCAETWGERARDRNPLPQAHRGTRGRGRRRTRTRRPSRSCGNRGPYRRRRQRRLCRRPSPPALRDRSG
ncbi:Os10g0181800, partial [Oryza sativa Japonica Group]